MANRLDHPIPTCHPWRCRRCRGLVVTVRCVFCDGPDFVIDETRRCDSADFAENEPTAKERAAIEARIAALRMAKIGQVVEFKRIEREAAT